MRFNGTHNFSMTLATGFFSHLTTTRRDVDVVFEPTCSEVIGMPETVSCLGCVFADEPRWRVAIVADGDRPMARLHPACILFVHHMTVYACLRVVCHIGITTRVDEGVRTHTYGQPEGHPQNNSLCQANFHVCCRLSAASCALAPESGT